MGSVRPALERSGRHTPGSETVNKSQPQQASTMEISQVFLLISGISFSLALPSPATGVLRSEYPEEPIENPAEWAWGQHPRNGLGYKAKDNLELEVCLANPHMIATAKCKIPLDLCLENPEWLPLVGCSAALDGYEATLFDCQDNKQFFCSRNMCEKHQFIVKC